MLIKYRLWYLQMGSSHFSFGSAVLSVRHSRAIGHFSHPAPPGLLGWGCPLSPAGHGAVGAAEMLRNSASKAR